MPRLQNISLTKTDFDTAGWQTLIELIAKKNCEDYSQKFFQKAAEAQASSDSVNEEVFTLLGAVCSMWLKPETDEVFHPHFVFYDPPLRGFVLDDLSDEHIAVLAEVATESLDAEIRARLTDVVWVKGRGRYYRLVEVGVRAYLESAKWMLGSSDELTLLAELRLKRALSLANSIRNRPLLDFAMDEIENIIASHNENDQEFPYAILLRLLLAYPSRNPSVFSDLSERLATVCESQSNWMYAQVYWQIKADWDMRAGSNDNQRASLIQAAEAHVKVGEIYANAEQPNYAAACFQLERALEIFRNIGGMRARCEEIHNCILRYQQASVDDFQHVSVPLDIDEFVEQSRQRVKQQPFASAILRLAFAERPTNKQTIRMQVESFLTEPSFHMLFSLVMVDHEGRRTASSPSLLNATEAEKEQVIKARMFMEAARHQHLVVAAIIEPMVHQISLDHYLQLNDLAFLVRHNGFIPLDRAYIYMKGLYAGLQGDYLVAAHLLIPRSKILCVIS